MSLEARDVFVPGSYPEHTYVERTAERLEQALRDAIDTPGQVVSLSGPSKSGKTVLVEKVIGRDNLIAISGAGIQDAEEVWDRVLDWMDTPHSQTRDRTTSGSLTTQVKGSGGVNLPGVLNVGAEGTVGGQAGVTSGKGATFQRRGLTQVVDEIAKSDFVVLVDDFHYMPRAAQEQVAKSIKEAVRLNVKVCTAAVTHRGDDVVRANPELRGRVRAIDLDYWRPEELREIATTGFGALNARVDGRAIEQFVIESAGSPQLMQLICLNACFVLDLRKRHVFPVTREVDATILKTILEQTSSSTDFRSLVDVLDAGPKTRGTERKTYRFIDDSEGDVYRCVLKAVAADPPRLSLPYDELTERTNVICRGESPVGSSVVGTCLHMAKLALDKFPAERVIDWDDSKQILDIPDPYLLFYLRWSGRLRET
jgi:hypothetical protein